MELTVTTFMTIDGVGQGPGGPDEDRDGGFAYGGWLVPMFDDVIGQAIGSWFERADAFLLGRRTYEIFAGHWPKVTDPDDPVATKLNALPKYVVTRTLDSADWAGTNFLRGDVVAAIRELKTHPGGEIQVHGSLDLLQTLVKNDLVDEFRLLIFPVVLGAGKRVFEDIAPTRLLLADSRTSRTGVMLQTYRAEGRPEFGRMPPPE